MYFNVASVAEGIRVDARASCQERSISAAQLALRARVGRTKRAMQMVRDTGIRRIGIVGLSFKAGTDDLRESPMVDVVETLLGWGCDVKIFDPNVMMSRLRGSNLAFVDRHLPHMANLLVPHPSMLLGHMGLLILGTDVANDFHWRKEFQGPLIDLRTDLGQ